MNRILVLFVLGLGLLFGCKSDQTAADTKPSFEVLRDTVEIDGELIILLDNINERVKFRSIHPDVTMMREYWDFDQDGEFDKYTANPRYQFPEPGNYIIKYCYNDPTNPAYCTTQSVNVRVRGGFAEATPETESTESPDQDVDSNTESNSNTANTSNEPTEPAPKKPVFINVNFKLAQQVDVGTTITLTDNSSPASEVNSRQWIVDGKSLGTGASVNYTFKDAGFHTVRLCINGTTNCIRKMVEVKGKTKPKPPKIVAKMTGPNSADPGEIITFSNRSTPTSYVRDYTWTVNKKTYTSSEIQFTIDKPGNYTVKLCVNGKTDCTSQKLKINKIKEEVVETPVTVIMNAPASVQAGQSFDVSDISSPVASVKSSNWTIDNKSYEGKKQTITFDTPGEYEIKLCVNGNEKCSTKKITVTAAPDAETAISVNFNVPSTGKVGETLTFQDLSGPADGIENRVWTIDNKIYNGKDVSHSFDSPGVKTIKLCINGTDDCKTATINIEASPSTPVAVTFDFSLPAKVNLGEQVKLISNASPKSAVKNTVWYVNSRKVGEGSSYTYNADKEGTFEITLEVNGSKKPKKVTVAKAAAKPVETASTTKNTGTYPENADEFYCNVEKTGGIASGARCGESFGDKSWTGATTIEFTAKKRCSLSEVMVSTNASGSLKIKISNGESYIEEDVFYVNRGESTIALEDLYYTFEPNWTYYMTITPVKGSGGKIPQLENSGPCNPQDMTDSNLKINYKNNYVIYDLKYCYQ